MNNGLRKHFVRPIRDKQSFSGILRNLSYLAQQNQPEEFLTKTDTVLSTATNAQQPRVLGILGDMLLASGRTDEAIQVYRKAFSTATEPSTYKRTACGLIRSLIDADNLSEAATVVCTAYKVLDNFKRQYRDAKSQLSQVGVSLSAVTIPKRPPEPSSIQLAYANALEKSGRINEAISVLQAIPTLEQTSKTRKSLVRLFIKSGLSLEAYNELIGELKVSGPNQNLVDNLSTLIRNVPEKRIDVLVESWRVIQSSLTPTAANLLLNLCSALHSVRDDTWIEYALGWVENNASVSSLATSELLRLLVTRSKAQDFDAAHASRLASLLMNAKGANWADWLSGARRYILAELKLRPNSSFKELERRGLERFGKRFSAEITLGLATIYFNCARWSDARRLYKTVISLGQSSPYWARSMFALARLESRVENSQAAAELYFDLASNTDLEPHFRLLAFQKWLSSVDEQTANSAFRDNYNTIKLLISDITSVSGLLLASRRLKFCPDGRDLSLDCIQRAENLIRTNGRIELTRKNLKDIEQLSAAKLDVGEFQSVIQLWQEVVSQLSLVLDEELVPKMAANTAQSFIFEGGFTSAGQIRAWVADKFPSGSAVSIVDVAIGEALVIQGNLKTARSYFLSASSAPTPSSKYLSRAYYWAALIYTARNATTSALDKASLAIVSLDNRDSMFEERLMLAELVLLSEQLGNPRNDIKSRIPATQLEVAASRLSSRLASLE